MLAVTPALQVNGESYNYPIYIGNSLLEKADLFRPYIQGNQVFIVTDDNVASHYLSTLKKTLSAYQVDTFILNSGEKNKTLTGFSDIIDKLITTSHFRSTTIIALGGGVVGDIAGFVAASYQRGVAYIQVPTSLLAQTDSSVGGKVAVNHSLGKNMIGAFYQPQCVIIDTNTLNTLPKRDFCAGLAEVIKYGAIYDAAFFTYLETHMAAILAHQADLLYAMIKRSCDIKATLVKLDEKDQGIRAILNFGHTFAHAIENLSNYQQYLHGEAVAIGMRYAAEYSCKTQALPKQDYFRLVHLLEKAQLPIQLVEKLDEAIFAKAMWRDKKVNNHQLTLVLLKQLGQAVLETQSTEPQMVHFLKELG